MTASEEGKLKFFEIFPLKIIFEKDTNKFITKLVYFDSKIILIALEKEMYLI